MPAKAFSDSRKLTWFSLCTAAVLFSSSLCSGSLGCATTSNRSRIADLRKALDTPIDSETRRQQHNDIARKVVEEGALEGLRRAEVEAQLGRGTVCGGSGVCTERGYMSNDWFYEVGRYDKRAAGRTPVLLVGFDGQGRCSRTHYILAGQSPAKW